MEGLRLVALMALLTREVSLHGSQGKGGIGIGPLLVLGIQYLFRGNELLCGTIACFLSRISFTGRV